MGIKELPACKDLTIISFEKFKKEKIAFDGLNWLYHSSSGILKEINKKDEKKFLSGNSKNLEKIEKFYNKEKIKILIIKKFIKINLLLLENEITPIWIWDEYNEKDKIDKLNTSIERKKNKEKNLKLFENLNIENIDIKKFLFLKKKTFNLSFNIIEEIKIFSKEIGLSNIFFSGEAEKLGSYLCINNIIKAFWSNDTDAYALGCKNIIKKITKKTFIISEYSNYVKNIGLNQEQFLDFCILLGTDYNPKILDASINKIKEYIKEYNTIENIFQNKDLKKLSFKKDFCNLNFEKIRKKFNFFDKKYEEFLNKLTFKGKKNINEIKMYKKHISIFDLDENKKLFILINDKKI